MYELNTSGKYFAFKEQLKYAVIKVVREKFLRTSPFHDEAELQAFLSSLYIYLADEMHVALNRYVSLEDRSAVPEKQLDAAQLKLFAEQAAQARDFALADKYYTEVRWYQSEDCSVQSSAVFASIVHAYCIT